MPRQSLDLTGNEPAHVTIGKIDAMLRERYAIWLPGVTIDRLDPTENEPLHRLLGRISDRIGALYTAAIVNATRATIDGTGNTPWTTNLANINAQLAAIYAKGDSAGVPPAWITDVRDGVATRRLVLYGNSRLAGSKGGDAGNNVDNRKNSPYVRLEARFRAAGINARADSFFPPYYPTTGTPESSAQTYDPSVVFGSYVVEGRSGFHSRFIRDNTGTTPLTYTPKWPFNALELWYPASAVSSTSATQVVVDGVVRNVTWLDGVGASQSDVVARHGTGHALVLTPERMVRGVVTGLTKKVQQITTARSLGDTRIAALIPYCSDEVELLICAVALSGATTSSFAVNSLNLMYGADRQHTYFPRHATYAAVITNNCNGAGVIEATTQSELAALDSRFGGVGEMYWGIEGYTNPAATDQTRQNTYRQFVRDVAVANSRKVLDFTARWGSYAQAFADGKMDADGTHETKYGYQVMGDDMFDFFMHAAAA